MAFHKGQKVVCVDNTNPDKAFREFDSDEDLIFGQIYTVLRYFLDFEGKPVVWLEEVSRNEAAIKEYGPTCGYGAFRFRPLIEKKTDISIFKKLENPTGKPAKIKELEKPKVVEKI